MNLNIKFELTETQVIHLLEGALIFNTTLLTATALWDRRRHRKIIEQWQTNHKYMMKINEGLNRIAANPKADPLENRAAINKLIDDVNAEILLDQVDFSGIEEHIKLKDEE